MHCNSKIPKAEQLAGHAHHTCFCFAELGPSNTKSSQSSQFGSALIPKITEGGADYGLWEAEPVRAGLSTKAQLWFPSSPMLSQGVFPGQASLPAKLLQKQFLSPFISPVNAPTGSVLQRQSPTSLNWLKHSISEKPSPRSAPMSSGLFGNTKFSLHWFYIQQEFCNW